MSKQLTAVEWLHKEMLDPNLSMKDILEKAKEMEKQQIIKAFDNGCIRANDTKNKTYSTAEDFGINYYNETFK